MAETVACCWLKIEIQTALIRSVVKFNVAGDHLPYLCPTRFLGLAMPLTSMYVCTFAALHKSPHNICYNYVYMYVCIAWLLLCVQLWHAWAGVGSTLSCTVHSYCFSLSLSLSPWIWLWIPSLLTYFQWVPHPIPLLVQNAVSWLLGMVGVNDGTHPWHASINHIPLENWLWLNSQPFLNCALIYISSFLSTHYYRLNITWEKLVSPVTGTISKPDWTSGTSVTPISKMPRWMLSWPQSSLRYV